MTHNTPESVYEVEFHELVSRSKDDEQTTTVRVVPVEPIRERVLADGVVEALEKALAGRSGEPVRVSIKKIRNGGESR